MARVIFQNYYTVSRIAAILGVRYNTIYKWVRAGKFPAPDVVTPGRHRLWHKDKLSQWLISNGYLPASAVPSSVPSEPAYPVPDVEPSEPVHCTLDGEPCTLQDVVTALLGVPYPVEERDYTEEELEQMFFSGEEERRRQDGTE